MSKIYVIGIGPGNKENMTLRAIKALEDSDIIIGYTKYIDLIQKEFPQKKFISSPMKKEVDRCELTIHTAQQQKATIALISSGDSGIYGMAGILLETATRLNSNIPIEIIPGVTSACASAALLGAPLAHDFAVISLSDLLTPLDLIFQRIALAAEGDFVIAIYNPKSKNRQDYIERAVEIVLKYKDKNTPVGIVNHAGREAEEVLLTTLENIKELLDHITMFSTIIIGNSKTYIENGRLITPRGYQY